MAEEEKKYTGPYRIYFGELPREFDTKRSLIFELSRNRPKSKEYIKIIIENANKPREELRKDLQFIASKKGVGNPEAEKYCSLLERIDEGIKFLQDYQHKLKE